MKRKLILIIALSVFLLTSVTVSASDRNSNDNDDKRPRVHNNDNRNNQHRVHNKDNRNNEHNNHRYHDNRSWRPTHHNDFEAVRYMPFRWHDHYNSVRERHHMERIYDSEWDYRFPGLFAHRWHGNGFWHHGRYVTDAVFFFDSDDRLVSIGYMHNGMFIHFRDDNECYENNDSFFIGWWRH